ncbi:N/A [soil metagenome]
MLSERRAVEFEIVDDPDPADVATLERHVSESTDQVLGHLPPAQLAVLHHGPTGDLLAGVYGWTWAGCCELQHLWVTESLRNRGIAGRLLDAAESEARRRGCTQIVLFAHAAMSGVDGTRWTRAGYSLVAQIPDYPIGDAARWYHKVLAPPLTRMVMRTL